MIVRSFRLVRFLALLLLVLVAVYMAVGRQFFPFVNSYKGELEAVLSEQLGVPVNIGSIEGSWRWLDPVLVVSDIELTGSHRLVDAPPLQVNSFYIHLSVVQSILKRKLQFQAIEADGITLPLFQNENGGWQIPGLPGNSSGAGTDFNSVLSVLEQPSLLVSNIDVRLLNSIGVKSTWNIPRAIMAYDGTAFSASGEILDTNAEVPFARFSAKGAGWVLSNDFTGKLYLDWSSGPLVNEYLGAYQWQGIHLDKIDAAGRLWLDILKGEVISFQGEVDVSSLQWEGSNGVVPPIKNIKADLFWSKLGGNSVLSVYDLSMEWLDHHWSPADYSVYLSDGQINISAQSINVSMLTELLLASEVLPQAGQQELAAYHPAGHLINAELMIPLSQDEPTADSEPQPLFQLAAEAKELSALAVGGAPAVSGVTGYVSVNDRQGTVIVDSDSFNMSFPNLFLDGWSFEKSQVIVNWDITEQSDVYVYSQGINLYLTKDSLVFGEFSLLLSDTEEDILSLKVGLNDLDAPRTYQLVPYHAVGKGVYDWLKSSIKGGVVESGLYVGYGSIEDDAPENSFTSSMVFNTQDARLLFDPNWPWLEGLDSKIFLQNGYLNIDAPKVSFRGTPLAGTQVEMRPDRGGEGDSTQGSWLNVTTRLKAAENELSYWLNDSPVSEYTQGVSSQLRLTGEFDVEVMLGIPLHDFELGVNYDLAISAKNSEITHRPSNLLFRNINGLVSLSNEDGLNGSSLSLDVMGFPALLDISSNVSPGEMDTHLFLTGDMSVEALVEAFDLEQSLPVSGRSSYTASLALSSDDKKNPLFTLSSSLSGIDIALPSPLNKNANATAPLTVQMEVADDLLELDATLSRMASLKAEFKDGTFKKGHAFIGDALPDALPDELTVDGFVITGVLKQLVVEPWLDYLQGEADQNSNDILRNVNLKVDSVNFYEQLFNSVDVNIQREGDAWSVLLEGDDVEGIIKLPEAKKPTIKLKSIQLSTAKGDEGESRLSPFDIPEMILHVDDLVVDGVGYGQWSTDLFHQENGLVAKNVRGAVAGTQFQGRLSWLRDQYDIDTTIVTATVNGADIAALSKALSKQESLTSKQFSSEVSIVWTGGPTDFKLDDLSGRIVVMLEDGTLLDTQSATEAFKVFGILNAEAIKRRLSLDFSDLYQKGLGYDRIEGVARMDKGTLTLEQPLAMQGPSSAYKFTGSANLKDETLDMDMVVVLPLTKNLPLAALFLGAPQIGGAVWVIDKLLGEPLSKLTSATYEMTGSWDNPDIKLKNVFDRTESFKGVPPSQKRREE
ncbi:YhdP family protein [Alkalimarinus coralli]|uniref:YhdP family protein n=1 Tax=Alkalimarinus coralli TaxID=2935863 RepID=UPI00202AEDB9|nr:YhdP family protein [Alkalimarinus coralli]